MSSVLFFALINFFGKAFASRRVERKGARTDPAILNSELPIFALTVSTMNAGVPLLGRLTARI